MVERVGRKHFYLDCPLKTGGLVLPRPLARRLNRVLRLKNGAQIALFNNKDGIWAATFDGDEKVTISAQLQPAQGQNGPNLYMCLLKKDAMDHVLRQATECGVSEIFPLLSDFTVPDKLNLERAEQVLVEAAEQCERGHVPKLHAPQPLQQALTQAGQVWWCDEVAGGKWQHATAPAQAILVGPEGGFSPQEREVLQNQPNVTPVGLGPHILRADTAVVAALSRFFEHLTN